MRLGPEIPTSDNKVRASLCTPPKDRQERGRLQIIEGRSSTDGVITPEGNITIKRGRERLQERANNSKRGKDIRVENNTREGNVSREGDNTRDGRSQERGIIQERGRLHEREDYKRGEYRKRGTYYN